MEACFVQAVPKPGEVIALNFAELSDRLCIPICCKDMRGLELLGSLVELAYQDLPSRRMDLVRLATQPDQISVAQRTTSFPPLRTPARKSGREVVVSGKTENGELVQQFELFVIQPRKSLPN